MQPHEFNYNITTREALAVLSSVRHFATYLRFTKFLIKTDHIDLKYIFKVQKTKQESHRLIRWALYLSGFDFTIQFCSGNSPEICMSDFLSRYDYEDQVEEVGALAHSFTVDELERLEADCVDCRTQSTTKIAEEQLPIIPDVEQMIRYTKDEKNIRNVQYPQKEIHQLFPEIMITDPKGNEVPFEEGYSTIIDTDFIQKENSLIETDFRHDDISTSDFDKNDFTNVGLDPFEDPQETPTVNEDDPIRTDVDKEPIKLTLRKNSEKGNNEYYIASKNQSQESQNNAENDSEQPSLKMTLKRRPNGNSDDYYISGYTLEMNDHLKALEQLENESEPNEHDLENLTTCDRQQMAEVGHYTHVDQLRDRLDYYPVGSFPEEKLRALQLEDPMGGMIIKYLEEQILPEEKRMRERVYKSENNFLIDENSRLLYHVELVAGGLVKDYCLVQLFVPEDICDYLIQEYHQRAHQGLDRLVAQIRQRYWFPRMVTKISNYINNCNICQLQKQLRNPFKAPLKTRKVVTNAGEVWYLDHFGPINTRKLGSLHSYAEDEPDNLLKEETKYCPYKYVLVAIDSYTLYTELILCKGTSAAETAKLIFEEIICRHSWPKALVHDQGTAFVNQLLEEFTRLTGMKNYQTAAMNPRANGVSEA